jgi:L-Ala-D/L-Glu epimerase
MCSVRVAGLTAFVVELPLRRPVRHASFVRTFTDNVIVRCTLSDGSVGWGEGVPREYVTGESADSAVDLLRGSDLKKQLTPCQDFSAAVRMAERLQLAPVPGDDRGCGGNAARCSAELAMLDAFGRSFGESLTSVTEQISPSLYLFQPKVQYSGAITGTRGWKLRALALYYRLTGFAQVKAKVGIAGADDVKRLRLMRRYVGRKMSLRVDANEAWSPAECADRMSELGPFNIDCVEQPVAHENIAVLSEIRKQVSIPIMLDESLCSMVDAERAAAGGWCDRFNLRLSKCGGFIPTLRLAEFASRNGLSYQLGCQVGESAILSGAGRHFAASVRGLAAIEGSFDKHLLIDCLAYRDLTFGRGGWASALGGGGHGAWVDPDAVESRARRMESIID